MGNAFIKNAERTQHSKITIGSLHVRKSGLRNPSSLFLWNPDSGKNFLLEFGILGFGVRNTAQGIQNPTNNKHLESIIHWQRLEYSTWIPESKAWNPESKTVLDDAKWNELACCFFSAADGLNLNIFLLLFTTPLQLLPLNMRPETRLIEDTNTNCKSLRAEQRKRYFVTGKVSGK